MKSKKKGKQKRWKLNLKLSNKYWLPLNTKDEGGLNDKKIIINTWFSNQIYTNKDLKYDTLEYKVEEKINSMTKCRKIIIKPNVKQKNILLQ